MEYVLLGFEFTWDHSFYISPFWNENVYSMHVSSLYYESTQRFWFHRFTAAEIVLIMQYTAEWM